MLSGFAATCFYCPIMAIWKIYTKSNIYTVIKVFIATGESKAKAIKELVEGEVSPACPATILQMHADVTIFLDKAAASLLGEKK